MKRYIRAFDNFEDIESIIIDEFGSENPGYGCSYIAPDGTFVNIYPELKTHEDMCDWIEEAAGCQLEYKDEEYFVREFGWVRLRTDPLLCLVEIPYGGMNAAQDNSLKEWLYFTEERYSGRKVPIYLDECDRLSNSYVEYSTEDPQWVEKVLAAFTRYELTGELFI